MAESASVDTRRKASKHDLFLESIPIMESRLGPKPDAFTLLQSLCVGQGILPRQPGAAQPKDGDSVSSGLSVREFLETIAEKIHQEEAVYDKFAHVLSLALGQDSLRVVLQEATNRHDAANETSHTSDSETDENDVFHPEERGDDDNVAVVGLLGDPLDPIDAVRQPLGAMALGERDVLRRRDNAAPYDIHSAENLQNASRTAQHEQQTRRGLESDLSNLATRNETLMRDVEQLSYEKECAFQELQRLSGEKEVKLEKHDHHMTELKKNIAAMEKEMNDIRKKYRQCVERIEEQKEKITSLTAQASKTNSLERNLASQEKEIQDLKQCKAEYQDHLQAKALELNELKAERDESIIRQGAAVKNLNKEILRCKMRIEELICQLSKEKETCSQQTKEIEKLRAIEKLYREDKCFVLSFLLLIFAAFCLVIFVSLYALFS